jgi:hypothetical protein
MVSNLPGLSPPPNPHGTPKPDRVEFKVGETIHKQPLRLVGELQNNGRRVWTLHRDQASQRDDSDRISGLSSDVIKTIAEAVAASERVFP